MVPRPGDIYYAFVEGPDKRRVIVVSREDLNRGDYVLVVPLTSRKFTARSNLRNCVAFSAGEYGLTENCVAQAEGLTLREKTDLDLNNGPTATLDGEKMREIIRAIGYVIASDCEPAE